MEETGGMKSEKSSKDEEGVAETSDEVGEEKKEYGRGESRGCRGQIGIKNSAQNHSTTTRGRNSSRLASDHSILP